MSTAGALFALLVAAWLFTMTFWGGLAHRVSGAV